MIGPITYNVEKLSHTQILEHDAESEYQDQLSVHDGHYLPLIAGL